jgi:hypothetical protein
MKKSLLATVAAAALIAGPGLATAQKQEAPASKTEAPARAPDAVQKAPAEKMAPAQRGTTGQASPPARGAQEGKGDPSKGPGEMKAGSDTKSGAGADTKSRMDADTKSRAPGAADSKAAAQPGQAKALTAEQRSKIRTTVLTSNAPRVTNVNFSIRVGTVVPRSVRLVAVPAPIIEIYPAYRGFLYFVHGDEIVIVEPGTLRIVTVIAV